MKLYILSFILLAYAKCHRGVRGDDNPSGHEISMSTPTLSPTLLPTVPSEFDGISSGSNNKIDYTWLLYMLIIG